MPQSDSTAPLPLELTDVSLAYGEFTVLKHISLTVKAGQVVAVMGGSGSGKTTLLRAATGQMPVAAGQLRLFGQDLSTVTAPALQALRQRTGVLFQQGALFTDLNVFENVAFPLREHTRLSGAEILDRVLDKLDAVGLRQAAHLKVAEISGGMSRRVALARAIVLEPELIFYDEPFAGLDPISMGVTARLIRELSNRLGCASLLITHDVDESFSIADQVYLIGQGQCIADGSPEQMRASTDPYVHQFLRGEPDGPVAFRYPDTPAFDRWLAQQKGARP